MPSSGGVRENGRLLALYGVFFVTLFSLAISVSMLLYSLIIVPGPLFYARYVLFIAVPWIIGLFEISGFWLILYHLMVVLAVILSMAILVKSDMRCGWEKVRKGYREQKAPPIQEENYWISMPRLLSISIFLPTAWYGVVYLLGPSPSVPGFSSFPLWGKLFGFAAASVWEEVIFRLLLLGLPIIVLMRSSDWRIVYRGGINMSRTVVILLLVSSFIFAAAHAFGGWDWFKVPPTFFTGVALGFLFIKKGLPGSILLHFSLNYFTVPMGAFSLLTGAVVLLFFTMLVCGAYYTFAYAFSLLKMLKKRKNTRRTMVLR